MAGIKLADSRYFFPDHKHKQTGNFYQFICKLEMKNPQTRKWQEAIMYKSEDGSYYVRDREDFVNKFEFIGSS